MATFKIRDLMVTLEAGPRGATAQERHRTLAQAHPDVPGDAGADCGGSPELQMDCGKTHQIDCGGSPEIDCGGSPEIVVVKGTPGQIIATADAAELALLKKQLLDLQAEVQRREEQLGQGKDTALRERSPKALKELEGKLSKALTGVRSKIAQNAKAASKSAKKKSAKKAPSKGAKRPKK